MNNCCKCSYDNNTHIKPYPEGKLGNWLFNLMIVYSLISLIIMSI